MHCYSKERQTQDNEGRKQEDKENSKSVLILHIGS